MEYAALHSLAERFDKSTKSNVDENVSAYNTFPGAKSPPGQHYISAWINPFQLCYPQGMHEVNLA